MKPLITLCTLFFICKLAHTQLDPEELGGMVVYYDGNMKPVPLLTTITEIGPTLRTPSLRFGFMPCSCEGLTCGCCVNMNIQTFNFEREGCMKFTYDPYEFSIGMNMLFDNSSIYENSVSAKNPPPLCMQVPVPYIPSVDFCVRLYNIFTPGRNIHMCVNFETKLIRVPVLILQFDCVKMGADGVSLWKPEENAGITPEVEDIDVIENAAVNVTAESAEDVENAEAVENSEAVENAEAVGNSEAVENAEGVSENAVGAENSAGIENIGSAENAVGTESAASAENSLGVENAEIVANSEGVKNATDAEYASVENAVDVENAAADFENSVGTENAASVENAVGTETVASVENAVGTENYASVENAVATESVASVENAVGTESVASVQNTETLKKPTDEDTGNNITRIITTDNDILE